MQKQFLAIIAVCLALTGCVKDVANLVLPIDETTDLAKSASYKMAGECGNLCGGFEWKTATTSDLQAELNAGAAVNGRDEDGTTPLHKAAWFGKPAHIKMLVGAGADLNAKNRWGINHCTGLLSMGLLLTLRL